MSGPIAFSAQAKTKPISVTDSASSSTALPGCGTSIRLVNEGPNVCFVSIGSTSQTATLPNATPTATSTPVAVGDCVLTIPDTGVNSVTAGTPLNISAICRSGLTATLCVQVGEGL